VLITGLLGYVRARDALERTIFDQLTVAARDKMRQIENLFRSIRGEMRLLAASRWSLTPCVASVAPSTSSTARPCPRDIRGRVDGWYNDQYMPMVRRLLGADTPVKEFLPAARRLFLQDWYVVDNPQPHDRRSLLDDAGDGSTYSKLHRSITADAHGGGDAELLRLPDGRSQDRPASSTRSTSTPISAPRCRPGPIAAPISPPPPPAARPRPIRRRRAWRISPTICRPTGAPEAFMAAPVVDHGVVIGVLVAQLSIDEIDDIVTGGRRWRHEGFGVTGEAYLVGPDFTVRSGRALSTKTATSTSPRRRPAPPPTISRHPPLRHAGAAAAHRHAGQPGGAGRRRGHREVLDFRRIPTLASWGPVRVSGLKWALIAEIDSSEAFAPVTQLGRDLMIVGAIALLVVIVTGAWLSHSLLGRCASSPPACGVSRRATSTPTSRCARATGRPALPRLQRHDRRDQRERTSSSRTRTARTRNCC